MKLKWEHVDGAFDFKNKPNKWFAEINHEKYGQYVYIEKHIASDLTDEYWVVLKIPFSNNEKSMTVTVRIRKSFAGAARWIEDNLLKKGDDN